MPKLFLTFLELNEKNSSAHVKTAQQYYALPVLVIVSLLLAIFLRPSASTVFEWIILSVFEFALVALNIYFYGRINQTKKISGIYLSLFPVLGILILNFTLLYNAGVNFLGFNNIFNAAITGGLIGLIVTSILFPKRLQQSLLYLESQKK